MVAVDAIDRKIIGELISDARISVTDLAARVHLSVSATSDRLRRLTGSGLVRRFTIDIEPSAAGRPIEAVIDLRLPPDVDLAHLEERLADLESIVNAAHMTGSFDMQLRVATADIAELDKLLTTLKDELGAVETNTRLVLRTVSGFPRPAALR